MIGFITFNTWANTDHNKTTEPSLQTPKTSSSERDTESVTKKVQENVEPVFKPSQEAPPLERLPLAKAIIEGNIEVYENSLEQLKHFNIKPTSILQIQDKDKMFLSELMITTDKNKEYFARELLHLLIFTTLENSFNLSLMKPDIKSYINLAREFNNQPAIQLLTDFHSLLYTVKKNTLHKEEMILQLLKRSKDRPKYTTAGKYLVAGGIMALIGYELFNPSYISLMVKEALPEILSSEKVTDIPLIVKNTIANNNKMIGGGIVALGIGLGATASIKCKKAFSNSRFLRRQKRNLNHKQKKLETL